MTDDHRMPGEPDSPPAHEPRDEPDQPSAAASREELWDACAELASSPDVLGAIAAQARLVGYAGPTTALELTYLAATTRLLPRPVSLALRGPASAGKSFAIKQALAFLPAEAYVELTAMSEKALVYFDEDLQHRMLVVYEGAGLSGDFLAYAVRTLLSEGKLEYLYTDFEHKTARRISKDGPTGLITSTTGRIDYELATRLITPSVEDTPELTHAIVRAEARAAQGERSQVDYEPFHALQRWVELGARDVVVPFAAAIAEKADHRAVRMRRDFAAILGLVQAHAMLHQQNRRIDADDRLVAELSDYAAVHGLVAGMVAEAAGATIPPSVRETVDAVRELELPPWGSHGLQRVTIQDVADALGISRSAASRRLGRAEAFGFVKNVQVLKAGPKVYETNERMPQDAGVLPHPDELS
jgi:hypothetical protein